MTEKIALVTDSSALLTAEQAAACDALVVPVTVTIDGVDHLDGVDIRSDRFFELLANDPPPSLATAQPSPARFLEAFERAAAGGATAVLAIVVGSAYSGTFDSARVAASQATIPVECLDTGLASFGVGLCVLAAAEALAAGSNREQTRDRVLAVAAATESVFIIQAIELARASGRFGSAIPMAGAEELSIPAAGAQEPAIPMAGTEDLSIPVLALAAGELSVLAEVNSLDAAVEVMAARVLGSGRPLRVASGLADRATKPVADALADRLLTSSDVVELLHYRVGPSVAANTGPGTAGVFWHPMDP